LGPFTFERQRKQDGRGNGEASDFSHDLEGCEKCDKKRDLLLTKNGGLILIIPIELLRLHHSGT
jgi:hypothetical protein